MEKNPYADWKIAKTWNNFDYVINEHYDQETGDRVIMKYVTLYEEWEEIEYYEHGINICTYAHSTFVDTILDCLGEIINYEEEL